MVERVAEFRIGIGGDDADIKSILGGLKTQFRSAVAELESTSNKVKLFEGLEARIVDSSKALQSATVEAASFAAQIDRIQKSGGKVSDELAQSFRKASADAKAASAEYNRSVDAITKLQTQLARAGVDTRNLAAEQQRLALATRQAADAAANQAAQQLLGLKTLRDVTPEIQRLHAAYNTLAVSGTLSVKELAQAQQLLLQRVAEVRAGVTGTASAAKAGTPAMVGFFRDSLLPAVGLTASLATVVAGLKEAVKTAADYTQRVAEISTVTKLSKDQLDALGAGARALSRDLGIDVNESLRGVFELLRSGVPEGNVLNVLRDSALAAKAGLSDVGTGVKAAGVLLDAFGAGASELPLLFDKITAGAREGGATFAEFASNGSALLNVARAARIDFDSLLAVLTVMVDKSGNAEKSFADLTKIIARLQTREVRNQLRDLGIESDNLVEIFRQIGERGLSLQQVLGIDLAGGGAKSAASLAALTGAAGELPEKLDAIREAAGSTSEAVQKLADTPVEKMNRLSAAVTEFNTQLGLLIATGAPLIEWATIAVRALTELEQVQKTGDATGTVYDNTLSRWIHSLLGIPFPAKEAAKATAELGAASEASAAQVSAAAAAAEKANAEFADLSAKLIASAQAMNEATSRNIADIEARAAAEIAALSKAADAQLATAAKTLEIQTKLGKDRLELIEENEKKVTEAARVAVAARTDMLRAAGKTEAQINAEIADVRLKALAPILAQYQDHYNKLNALAQTHAATTANLERERLEFNRGVEKTLFDLRVGGLSVFDQYVAKVKEIDRLIAQSREDAAKGDLAAAKKNVDAAIKLSGELKEATSANGAVIVSKNEAQATSVRKIEEAARAYNEALDKQDDLAKQGFDATKAAIDGVLPKLQDLQQRYDDLKAAVGEGLDLKVQLDQASVAAAFATLDELSKPRETTITVRTVQGNAGGGYIGRAVQAFREGGSVGNLIQRFAGGGTVFRRPSWVKVPGAGDGDTVPAALQEGSFVVRKAASQMYGDGIMSRLAQAFAGGGEVFSPGSIAMRILAGLGLGGGQNLGVNPATVKAIEEFKTARYVVEYALEVLRRYGNSGAGAEIMGYLGDSVQGRIRYVQSHPTDASAIDALLAEAGYLGANIPLISFVGKTASPARPNPPFSFSDFVAALRSGQGFAAGGAVGDTVPAMLTPGEFVLTPRAVSGVSKLFGGGFLHALNAMRVPRGMLDGMMNFAPPSRPLAFAAGGPVPGAPQNFAGGGPVRGRAAPAITVNVYAQRVDEAEVRRSIIPAIDKIMRRKG